MRALLYSWPLHAPWVQTSLGGGGVGPVVGGQVKVRGAIRALGWGDSVALQSCRHLEEALQQLFACSSLITVTCSVFHNHHICQQHKCTIDKDFW